MNNEQTCLFCILLYWHFSNSGESSHWSLALEFNNWHANFVFLLSFNYMSYWIRSSSYVIICVRLIVWSIEPGRYPQNAFCTILKLWTTLLSFAVQLCVASRFLEVLWYQIRDASNKRYGNSLIMSLGRTYFIKLTDLLSIEGASLKTPFGVPPFAYIF